MDLIEQRQAGWEPQRISYGEIESYCRLNQIQQPATLRTLQAVIRHCEGVSFTIMRERRDAEDAKKQKAPPRRRRTATA